MSQTVLSVFGIEPFRIGSNEAFARELSFQLGQRGYRSVLCFLKEPPEAVRRYLELPNVSFEVLPNSWQINWAATAGMWRILRKHRPRILHLHYTGFLSAYPWLARLCSVARVFFTDHGSRPAFHVPRQAPAWKRIITRTINQPISRVVSVSDYGYSCMAAANLISRDRLQRIYNGIDLTQGDPNPQGRAAFRRKYEIPENSIVVLQVSWMIPEKGIPDLLAAARLVVSRDANAHFVLVGEGKFRDEYMRSARELGLEERVTWTGLVENPFQEGVFAAADVVCQFSHWEEVFGWVIAEAMAHRKPLVATRVGGIPELVKDGETGFLVARGDTAAMAEKICLLLADSALRERMGRAGRAAAEEKFDLTRNVAQLIGLYDL